MSLTTKQIEILKIVGRKNADGTHVDLDQLLDQLSHKPSKEALQFSLRALIKGHKYLTKVGDEKRRGRRRVLFGLTVLGGHIADQWLKADSSGHNSLKAALIEED